VDLGALHGSDRHELTRNDQEGKDKGLRKQFQETQAHYVAHASSQLALADAQQALAGVILPDTATNALEFLADVAEKGVARAKARAKILALVSDKGPEVGWKVCEKLERKSYAEDEEDEKAIRKAEKEVKAEKLLATQAAAAKGRAKQLAASSRNVSRSVARGAPSLPNSPLQPGRGAGLQCWNCQQWGHATKMIARTHVARAVAVAEAVETVEFVSITMNESHQDGNDVSENEIEEAVPLYDFAFAVRAVSLTDPAALAVMDGVMRDVREACWLVSEAKSQLFFTRRLVHIGIGIDLEAGVLFVPDKALSKIRACVSDILRVFHRVPLRLVAKFAGLVNSQWFVLGGVSRLFARAAAVLIADTLRWGTWSSHVPGSDQFRQELSFWLTDGFRRHQRGIWEPRGAGLQIETLRSDASEVAWGSWLESSLGGPEPEGHSYLALSDRLKSSTLRELRGILDSLRAFDVAGRLREKRVLVICDNQAVHFVLECGSRHEELQLLALEVFEFCADHAVVLSSMWMPREFEARADALSKIKDHDDWMVNPAVFQWVSPWIAGGRVHTRDRFATDKNCLVFGSAGVVGSGQQWAGLRFSAADPLEMKLREDMLQAVSGTRERSTMQGCLLPWLGICMWTGFWRYDCAEKVRLKDVKFCETRMTTFLEEKRKTDKYRYGQLVEVARAAEGQPICPVETAQRLDYQQLRRYLFRMLGDGSGQDPDALRQLFGTQSLRSGGATAVAAADQVTDFEFNQFGGWSSSEAAATYKATKLDRRLAVSRSMPHAQQSRLACLDASL
ncbi:hypothetical protein CYMTET_31501, partial [Cymbomonas tetramitiformis]